MEDLDERIDERIDQLETQLFLIKRFIDHGDRRDEDKVKVIVWLDRVLKATDPHDWK